MTRTRWFWGLLAVLVIAAAVPRLLIYDFSLPYLDHPDEGTSYLEARTWRGEYDLGGGHPGYPPGHIVVNYAVQSVVEGALNRSQTATIHVMRLFSVTMNLTALALIAWTARMVAGDAGGLLAGVLWGVSPIVVTNNVIAIPDPTLYTLTIASIATATFALTDPTLRHWGMVSFVIGLVAVVVKYQAFLVLIPGGIISLVMMREYLPRGAAYLAVQVVLAVIVA
ncbi:MAG: glycosyltransferase family 39 protein, partial [Chloroflexota bacterium]